MSEEVNTTTTTTTPPPPPKAPKPPKPVITPHENGRDMLLCSPAFATMFVDGSYCVVGGGGGGKKYENPNALAVVKVSNPSASKKPGPESGENHFWEVVTTLDFEEAGTIQSISDCFIEDPSSSSSSSTNSKSLYFIVTHINSFSLVRYTRDSSPQKITLTSVSRVALQTDPINSDTKPVTIVNLSPSIGGPLIFATQDNQTVAVFRLNTLLQWAKQEATLKSADHIAVANTIEDVKNQALCVCEFPTGGKVCDLKTKLLHTSVPQNANDVCIIVAICTRDKSFLVGHFDHQGRKFIPSKKFSSYDFGFDKDFMKGERKDVPFPVIFTGKSVRNCQFSRNPAMPHFSSTDSGKFVGVSTDVFVAIQPLKMGVCAARIRITSSKSSIETISVTADALVKSKCFEPPASSTMLPTQTLDDGKANEDNFLIGTVEGSLIEFVFPSNTNQKPAQVRRLVNGFHADAVSCIAVSSSVSNNNNNNKSNNALFVASSDIARRIAFHSFDPFSRSTYIKTTEKLATVTQLPDLFTQEISGAFAAKQKKRMILRWIVFCIFGLILAFIGKLVLEFLGFELY